MRTLIGLIYIDRPGYPYQNAMVPLYITVGILHCAGSYMWVMIANSEQQNKKEAKYPMQLNKGGQPLAHLQRIRQGKEAQDGVKRKTSCTVGMDSIKEDAAGSNSAYITRYEE